MLVRATVTLAGRDMDEHNRAEILVVDDDRLMRTFVSDALGVRGFDVTAASDGGEWDPRPPRPRHIRTSSSSSLRSIVDLSGIG